MKKEDFDQEAVQAALSKLSDADQHRLVVAMFREHPKIRREFMEKMSFSDSMLERFINGENLIPSKARKPSFTKMFAGVAAAGLASIVALQAALLKFPDMVSSTLPDYMKRNNIPAEMVKGIRTDGIRVYDDNGFLAANHAFAYVLRSHSGKLAWSDRIEGAFETGVGVFYNSARNISNTGQCMVVGSEKVPIKEYLAKSTGIPLEDLDIDEKFTVYNTIKTLMHEVWHSEKREYKSPSSPYCEPVYFDKQSDVGESTISSETMADYGAIQSFGNVGIDISKFIISWRALHVHDLYYHGLDPTHNTAYYLDALMRTKKADDLPDIKGDWDDYKAFSLYLYDDKGGYETVPSVYRRYMRAMDFVDQAQTDKGISPRAKRMAELYAEGFEYFAPKRAAALRVERAKLNPAAAPAPSLS